MEKQIYVKQGFVLTHDNGDKEPFPVGRHKVSKEIADHWFVKLHLGDENDAEPGPDADLVQVAEAEIEQLKQELAAEKAAREAAEATLASAKKMAETEAETAIKFLKEEQERADKAEKQITALHTEIEQLKKKGK